MSDDAHLKIVQSPQFAFNKEFYDDVIAKKDSRKLVYKEVLKPHTGDAFLVKAGQVIRAEQMEDFAQILDWFIVTPDLTEYLNYGHSAPIEGPYLRKYTRCWSNSGYLHPMATMVADEVPDYFAPEGWGKHFWMFHCNPEWNQAAAPDANIGHDHSSCHTNFMHGLARIPAIHAMEENKKRETIEFFANMCNFMTFQVYKVGWDEAAGTVNMDLKPGPDIPKGTGVEFYAEQDIYCVISSCPWASMQDDFDKVVPKPVEISVWDTGIAPLARPQWKEWKSQFYDQLATGKRESTPRTEDSYNRV